MEKNIELKMLHSLELKIALEIKRVCKKNNIRFFLAYGSLLGAVRHNGFIPWDDDLDIAMPREDYEKFIRIFNQETNTDEYFLENWDTEANYGLSFTKIKLNGTVFEENSIRGTNTHKGIFVDVFPYDELIGDKKKIRKTARRVLILGKIYKFRLGYLPTNPKNRRQKIEAQIIGALAKPISKKWIRRKLYQEETRYNGTNAPFTTFISGAYNVRDYFERSLLDESIEMEFEGVKFPIPENYEQILTCIYGDYMHLPPVEKRVFRHNASHIEFGRYEK